MFKKECSEVAKKSIAAPMAFPHHQGNFAKRMALKSPYFFTARAE
jgi:hypothetical protein